MVTKFQFIPLDPAIYPHTSHFWFLEGKASRESPYTHVVVPNGVCTLLFIYEGSFKTSLPDQIFSQGDLVIAGPLDQPGKYVLTEDFGFFAVCLQPYVVPILLSLPGTDLMNKFFPGSDFEPFRQLADLLIGLPSNDERTKGALSELSKINQQLEAFDPDFCKLVKEMSGLNPQDLQSTIAKAELSTRQFQRKFKALTGYTPVHYLRIARIQTILDQTNPKDLTRLALAFGYYDQSHFINDFKKITGGITPSQYFEGLAALKWKSLGESVAFFQS